MKNNPYNPHSNPFYPTGELEKYSENHEEIDLGYEPRPFQAQLHNTLKRFNVLVCHRRFGKTVFSIMETVDKAFRNERKNPQYAYIAPTYGQAKRVAWEYFKDYTKGIPGAKPHEQELRIDIPRPDRGDKIRFMLLGAENPDSLRESTLMGLFLTSMLNVILRFGVKLFGLRLVIDLDGLSSLGRQRGRTTSTIFITPHSAYVTGKSQYTRLVRQPWLTPES